MKQNADFVSQPFIALCLKALKRITLWVAGKGQRKFRTKYKAFLSLVSGVHVLELAIRQFKRIPERIHSLHVPVCSCIWSTNGNFQSEVQRGVTPNQIPKRGYCCVCDRNTMHASDTRNDHFVTYGATGRFRSEYSRIHRI